MIHFRKLRYKNFLSTGDNFTEIDFTKTKTALVVGENGSGKSTMLDALSFGLFGKAHRNINKPQLVNSVNGKGAVVEVEFSVDKTHSIRVVRGLKPNRFEIWQNDEMVNQESNVRDYQKFLEQNILKLNHKSFHQVVVLGSSSFIPFMQLSAQNRREVIEDLLDIQIFSRMNQLVKERASKLKDEIDRVDYLIDLNKNIANVQKEHIRQLQQINDTSASKLNATLNEKLDELKTVTDKTKELQAVIAERENGELKKKIQTLNSMKRELIEYRSVFESKVKTVVKTAKFYDNNDNCPTCEQPIDPTLKDKKLHDCKKQAVELNGAIADISNRLTDTDTELDRWQNEQSELDKMRYQHESYLSKSKDLYSEIKKIRDDMNAAVDSTELNAEREKLEKSLADYERLMEKKLELNEERRYNDAANEMLKDTGIKTRIIREYLPAMNELINKYLGVLDFFVSFYLDESFNETLRSRHRDDFSYASFSEGEKTRINLALLFTWRQIAKMKNSASTNILILDEIFDSSLDQEGVDNLMKILHTLDERTHVMIISHKGELLEGKFERKLEFRKEGNFSKLTTET